MGLNYFVFHRIWLKKVVYHHLFFYNAEFKVCKFYKRKVSQGGTVVLCALCRVPVWKWFSSSDLIKLYFSQRYLCLRFKWGKRQKKSPQAGLPYPSWVVRCDKLTLFCANLMPLKKYFFVMFFRLEDINISNLLRNLQLSWKIKKSLRPRALQIFLPGWLADSFQTLYFLIK